MKLGQVLPIEINKAYLLNSQFHAIFINELLEFGLFYVRYEGGNTFTELMSGKKYILHARWLHGPVFKDMKYSRDMFGDN